MAEIVAATAEEGQSSPNGGSLHPRTAQNHDQTQLLQNDNSTDDSESVQSSCASSSSAAAADSTGTAAATVKPTLPSVLKRNRKFIQSITKSVTPKVNDLSKLGLDISHVFFAKAHDGIVIDIDTSFVQTLNTLVIATVGTDGIVKLWSVVPKSVFVAANHNRTRRRRSLSDKVADFWTDKFGHSVSDKKQHSRNNSQQQQQSSRVRRPTSMAKSDDKRENTKNSKDFETLFLAQFGRENTRFYAVQIDFTNSRQRVALCSLNGQLTVFENLGGNRLDIQRDHSGDKRPVKWERMHHIQLPSLWTGLTQSTVVSSSSFRFISEAASEKPASKQSSLLLLSAESSSLIIFDYRRQCKVRAWQGSSDMYCVNPWLCLDASSEIISGCQPHDNHGSVLFTFSDVHFEGGCNVDAAATAAAAANNNAPSLTGNSRTFGQITVEQITIKPDISSNDEESSLPCVEKPLRIEYVLNRPSIKCRSLLQCGSKPIIEISPDGRTVIVVDTVVYFWCVSDYLQNDGGGYSNNKDSANGASSSIDCDGYRVKRLRCRLVRTRYLSHYTSVSVSWIDNTSVVFGYNEIGSIFGTQFQLQWMDEIFSIVSPWLDHSRGLSRIVLDYCGVNFSDFTLRSDADRRIASMMSLPLPLRRLIQPMHRVSADTGGTTAVSRRLRGGTAPHSEWQHYSGFFVIGLWSATIDLFLFQASSFKAEATTAVTSDVDSLTLSSAASQC